MSLHEIAERMLRFIDDDADAQLLRVELVALEQGQWAGVLPAILVERCLSGDASALPAAAATVAAVSGVAEELLQRDAAALLASALLASGDGDGDLEHQPPDVVDGYTSARRLALSWLAGALGDAELELDVEVTRALLGSVAVLRGDVDAALALDALQGADG